MKYAYDSHDLVLFVDAEYDTDLFMETDRSKTFLDSRMCCAAVRERMERFAECHDVFRETGCIFWKT